MSCDNFNGWEILIFFITLCVPSWIDSFKTVLKERKEIREKRRETKNALHQRNAQ